MNTRNSFLTASGVAIALVVALFGDNLLGRLEKPPAQTPSREAPSTAEAPSPIYSQPAIANQAEPLSSPTAPKPDPTVSEIAQSAPPTTSGSGDGVAAPSPPPQEPDYPRQVGGDHYGVRLVLQGLAARQDKYVATIRMENSTLNEAGIALLDDGGFSADGYLADDRGGNCQLVSNGDSYGSLRSMRLDSDFDRFTYAAPKSFLVILLFFNRPRCSERIDTTRRVSITGTMVLKVDGKQVRFPYSFSDLPFQ